MKNILLKQKKCASNIKIITKKGSIFANKVNIIENLMNLKIGRRLQSWTKKM
jgi:hypothetical protein